MLNIKNYFFTLSLIIAPVLGFAQQVLSLDSVFNIIKENNTELKIYDLQIESQNALVSGASAWMAPMVGVSNFMTPYNNYSLPANERSGSLMFMVEQKIPAKGKISTNKAYLASQSKITSQAKAESFNELKAMARSYYFEALTEQKKLDFLSKNLQILQNLKKIAEIRYTYNQADLAQIYSLKARVFEIENSLTAKKANINVAKIRLNTLMNRPKDIDFKIDTSINYIENLKDLHTMPEFINRSNVKQIDAQIKSLELENKMIASEAKPEFGIQFNHMITYNVNMGNQYSLQATVSLPIAPWASKSYKSRQKANEFEALAMQVQKDNLVNNLEGAIKSEHEHLMHMSIELSVYKESILPNLNKSFNVMLLNYQENKVELNKVFDSWKDVNDSELNYLMLLNDYYQTFANYEKNVER